MSNSPTVLIAVSEGYLRRMIARILGTGGWAVQTVATGAEALERGDFDVLVLKRRLEDMEGTDLVRSLRRTRPGLRSVLLIGTGDLVFPVPGVEVLEMPFHAEELRETVGRIRRHGPTVSGGLELPER